MRACVRALRGPGGWGINKVTVQLESRCISSTAAYKADGEAGGLKKNNFKKHIMNMSPLPILLIHE